MIGISTTIRNGIRTITFANPKKKNALSGDNYGEIGRLLNEDAKNKEIIATILTGAGDYFTSGNDLTAALKGDEDFETVGKRFHKNFTDMITAIINYPKLLISVVNGPAIGIGLTIVGLSDIVYASSNAYFAAPFVKLGLCIEGCGSYMLPRILGKSKAFEVLILGHKLTAEDAQKHSLVSKIIKPNEVNNFINSLMEEIGRLPLEPVVFNKKLITENIIEALLMCAQREAKQLWECQNSEFFMNKMIEFMNRKSKL